MKLSSTNCCLVVALALWCLVVGSAANLDPKRVILFDHATDPISGVENFLFRTNEPVDETKKSFDYDTLQVLFRQRALEQLNVTIPDDVYTVDINLLNGITEKADIDIEKAFFDANPQLGEFINWPIIGDFISPESYPQDTRELLARTLMDWQIDRLIERVIGVLSQLQTFRDKPTIVFIHCEAGEDRTGEMFGSYMMQFKNWTWEQTLEFDDHVESRNIRYASKTAMRWFCESLRVLHEYPLDCTYDDNPPKLQHTETSDNQMHRRQAGRRRFLGSGESLRIVYENE